MTRCGWISIAAVLASLTAPVGAHAQQPTSSQQTREPIVRVTIDPPRVVVSQKTTLQIDVLAPNYMTSPPVLPEFQIRNAVTRPQQSVNFVEQHDGTTYAGVRFEFAIYPQEAGAYAVSDQTLTVTYAAVPPKTREVTLPLPRIEFQSFIPDAAVQLDPFVAATSLTIAQTVQQSSDPPKVGDTLTRTVTIKAEGVPAMLLPPVAFPTVTGLAVYPAQPIVRDQTDARTGGLATTRVDAATYVLQEPGDYLLPAVAVRWWNVRTERIETAQLDTISLHVLDNPAAQRGAPPAQTSPWRPLAAFVDLLADHWLLALLAIGVLAALAWSAPRAARAIAGVYRRQHDRWLVSEARAFARLRAAARHRDAGKVYAALLDWLARFDPVAPNHTLDSFKALARDPALDRQIDAIERELFAPRGGDGDWSGRKLVSAMGSARRRLLRHAARTEVAGPLPRELNPVATHPLTARHLRPVAR